MTNQHDKVEADLTELGKAAVQWTATGSFLYNAGLIAQNEVSINKDEIGLFTNFYHVYMEVAKVGEFASNRLTEGVAACDAISTLLRQGEATYRQEEDDNKHSFMNLY